jgi:hypothetical protein
MIEDCDLSTGPEGVDKMVREKGKGDNEEGGNCSSLRDTEMAAPRTSHADRDRQRSSYSAYAKHMLLTMLQDRYLSYRVVEIHEYVRSKMIDIGSSCHLISLPRSK